VNGSAVQVVVALAQAVALLMSTIFITYTVIIVIHFLRYRPERPGDGGTFAWHLFVPALNEEKVIGQTVDYLRATFPTANVWVINDDSDDQTGPIVASRARADPQVHLVSRAAPDARTGKGDALNTAYRELNQWLPMSADRTGVIVGVVDADGRPAVNCLDVCAGDALFGDPGVGSVQILVRMINRDDPRPFPRRGRCANALGRALVRLQDVEFGVPIAAIQVARGRTGTVGLGGNGQFSRLSALDMVTDEAGRPWRGALLEDYELGVHMLLAGQRNEYTRETHVDQEGLPDLRRLVRQRTRWGQGNMQCGIYLRRLWASRHVSRIGALEATYYLAQPWLQLAGSVVYPFPLAVFLANYLRQPSLMTAWLAQGWLMLFALYVILGLGPYLTWGVVYRLCERRVGVIGAIGLGFGYSLYVLMFYVTSWRAFCRILRGRREWFKTRRNAEFLTDIDDHSPPAPVGGIQIIKEIIGGN
jgi:1,2-diacylglycerol 3-beta-glucosyltransferase